jgi:hypothetical protein
MATPQCDISLVSKEYKKNPLSPMPCDLCMLKFMITSVSCFILGEASPISGGHSQNGRQNLTMYCLVLDPLVCKCTYVLTLGLYLALMA